MAVTALGALLGIVTLLGGFASGRLHAAYREALRDLRESERRLDAREAGHVDGRLEPELRWLAEIRDAARDSRWRESALVMALLSAAAVTIAVWALVSGVGALEGFAVVALAAAAVLVTVLLAWDGQRIGRTLVATTRRTRLWGLLRLENALAETQRATVRQQTAHRAWLRASAAGQPLAGVAARWRARQSHRASARQQRAVDRLPTPAFAVGVLDQLHEAGVRPPAGYVDGVRGLIPLVGRGSPRLEDDSDWDATLADLTRAVEQDEPRRLRWLSALAACAELRDDPVARESAARWALDVAAMGPSGAAVSDRYDPLPDAALVEPVLPATWEGAVRRARETKASASLLASVVVRWAYALVLSQPDRSVDSSIAPAVDAAVEIMQGLPERESDRYLRLVRAGLADLGASGAQMGRLVPPRAVPPAGPVAPPAGPGASDERTVVLAGAGYSSSDPAPSFEPAASSDPAPSFREPEGVPQDQPGSPEPAPFPREPAGLPSDPPSPYHPTDRPPAPRDGDPAEFAAATDRTAGGATVADTRPVEGAPGDTTAAGQARHD